MTLHQTNAGVMINGKQSKNFQVRLILRHFYRAVLHGTGNCNLKGRNK